MPDLDKSNKKENYCSWWERHKWTKWEEIDAEIVNDQHRSYIEHVLKRTCYKCGIFEFKHIDQFSGNIKRGKNEKE